MKKRLFVVSLVLFIITGTIYAGGSQEGEAAAEDTVWTPQKPIHLICTTDPGSTYDIQARVVASEMAKALDATVIVDNVPGAGHQTGNIQAYRSQPDGYTILYTSANNLVNGELLANAPWDTFDFIPLATTYDAIKGGSGVFATESLGTWEDIVASGKTIRWATAGPGSTPHIQAVMYSHALGIDAAFVTGYSGKDMTAAAARGEVDCVCQPMRYAAEWEDDLNVVLIDAYGPYEDEYGNVPSLRSLGHPEAESRGMVHVVVAVPGTPKNIVDVLADAAYTAVSSDAMEELHNKSIASGSAYSPGDAEDAAEAIQTYWDYLNGSLDLITAAIEDARN